MTSFQDGDIVRIEAVVNAGGPGNKNLWLRYRNNAGDHPQLANASLTAELIREGALTLVVRPDPELVQGDVVEAVQTGVRYVFHPTAADDVLPFLTISGEYAGQWRRRDGIEGVLTKLELKEVTSA